MSQEAFNRVSGELSQTIRKLFEQGRTTPTFLLLYVSIDVLASLTRPIGRPDTDRSFFKDWVNEFMLPGSGLPCTADDIYAARCGLLHTFTAESRDARIGSARMINYVGDNDSPDEMQRSHDPACATNIFVSTRAFVDAFFTAFSRFEQKVRSDRDLQTRVYHHFGALLVESRGRLIR